MLDTLIAATSNEAVGTNGAPGNEAGSGRTFQAVLAALRDDRVLVLDGRGTIQAVSRPAAEWLAGGGAEEWIGQNVAQLLVAGDREAGLAQQLLDKAARRGETEMEMWVRKGNGVEAWAALSVHCRKEGTEPEYVLSISPGFRGPDELDRLRAMLRFSPAGIWMTNAAGHVLEASPQFGRWAGGAGAGDYWPAHTGYVSAEQRSNASEARRMAHERQRAYRIEYFDKMKRRLIESGEPRFDAQGGFVGFVGSLTESAELAPRPTDGSFEFLGRLSQEVREQASRILRALELATDASADLAAAQGEVIEAAAQALLRQVENVATLSREPHGRERIVFDPQPLLRDVVQDAASVAFEMGRGLDALVNWELPARVLGDVSGMRQLLRVMLEHAVLTARPGGGLVTFELDAEPGGAPGEIPLLARVRFDGPDLEPGLEEWLASGDGTPTQFGDAGIRLRLARHAALTLGAPLEIAQGELRCRFKLAQAAEEQNVEKPFTGIKVEGKRVVVVAQEPLRGVLCARAAALKVDFTAFETGFEAKEWLSQPGRSLDLAIVQYAMPGLDGCELARWMRAARPDLPMITVSMQGEPGQGKAAREAGFQGYLTPPLGANLLEDAMKLVLAGGVRNPQLVTRFRIEEERTALAARL